MFCRVASLAGIQFRRSILNESFVSEQVLKCAGGVPG
jgi:hypothetical protein